MSISKKAWTFPARPYYYILSFPKINRKPNNSKTEGERDIPGPRDDLEGKRCLAGSSLVPLGTYRAPGAAPCAEELPCRFLSRPMTLSRTGCIPAAPNKLQWPLWGMLQLDKITHLGSAFESSFLN